MQFPSHCLPAPNLISVPPSLQVILTQMTVDYAVKAVIEK